MKRKGSVKNFKEQMYANEVARQNRMANLENPLFMHKDDFRELCRLKFSDAELTRLIGGPFIAIG